VVVVGVGVVVVVGVAVAVVVVVVVGVVVGVGVAVGVAVAVVVAVAVGVVVAVAVAVAVVLNSIYRKSRSPKKGPATKGEFMTCSVCGKDLEEENIYFMCDETTKDFCESCWDRVDCELYHEEGCSTTIYNTPPTKCVVDGEEEV
jgi:hypothetical protein